MDGGANRALSLIIPAYNEEDGIQSAIAEADEALAELNSPYEILVVDDGSSDATSAIVEDAAATRPAIHLLRHPQNRGYGAALRTGFEAARFERVAFTDADCQFDLRDLGCLVPLTDRDHMAVGYRAHRQDPWHRRFYSWGYNQLVRALLGTQVRDCDCALKVFRKEALAKLLPESSGFFVNAEMLTRARQLGYRVTEASVRHRPRGAGTSKVSFLDILPVLASLLPFWWSHVLFAGGERTESPKPKVQSRQQDSRLWTLDFGLLLLIVVAGLLFFWRLRCPLLEPEEARYAEIPRQMLAKGCWIVPVLHGQPYYHKPPLLYWLVMASYSALGVHDWAARLIPSGAALLVVVLSYLWGKRTVGLRAALAGALILCLSARFVYWGRMLTMDSLLCLWIVAAWAGAHLALGRHSCSRTWWLLSAGACGLGLLTKGPVALVLVTVPILAYQALDYRSAPFRLRSWLAYLATALGLSAPWYALVAIRDPAFLTDFFWTHNILRYITPIDHEEPIWFFLPGLLLGMLPWTLLLAPMAKSFVRRSAASARRRPAALGVFLLTSVWCLAFYSAAGCKRPGYILPAMPPLALALGCSLDSELPRNWLRRVAGVSQRRGMALVHGTSLLIMAGAVVGAVTAIVAGLLKPTHGLPVVIAAAGAFLYLWRRGPNRYVMRSWAACAAMTFVLLFLSVDQLLPGYARKFSLRSQVGAQTAIVADEKVPIACYPHRWDSVSFYLGRDDIRVYAPEERSRLMADLRANPNTIVFVKSDRSLSELLRYLPASLEFVPRGAHHGIVTAGLICRRPEAAATLLARR